MLNATPTSSSQTTPAVPVGMKKAQENVAGSMGSTPGAHGPLVSPTVVTTTTLSGGQTASSSTTTTDGTGGVNNAPMKKIKKKFPLKYIIGGIVFVLLLIGIGAGYYLTQVQQDIRQRAAFEDIEPYPTALPTPIPTPVCSQALDSCESTPCCGDLVCQGTAGNRKCQSYGDQDVCPGGGSCTGYYSFQCSSLAVTPESSGVPVCQENSQFHNTDRSAAISRASATGCGQWDQVCVGGSRNGQLCGDFAVINNSCGAAAPAPQAPAPTPIGGTTPTPTPTPVPANEFVCTKRTYANESTNTAGNYRFATEKSTFAPGDIVVFRIVVRNRDNETLAVDFRDQLDTMLEYGTLLDHSCPGGQVNSNNLLQCDFNIPVGGFQVVGIRLQLNNNIANGSNFTNRSRSIVENDVEVCDATVSISSTSVPQTPQTPDEPQTVNCNEACSASYECADVDHFCDTSGGAGVCRLIENPSSETCQPAVEPTSAYCGEACTTSADCTETDHVCIEFGEDGNTQGGICRLKSNPTSPTCSAPTTPEEDEPTEPPSPGCNQTCTQSSDCTNSSAVCFDGVCRLSSNPTNTSCVAKSGDTTPTTTAQSPGVFYEQPDLPGELPESGSQDIFNWLKVGLGILGLGLIFLFL